MIGVSLLHLPVTLQGWRPNTLLADFLRMARGWLRRFIGAWSVLAWKNPEAGTTKHRPSTDESPKPTRSQYEAIHKKRITYPIVRAVSQMVKNPQMTGR
ncbi:hypothetical protein [Parapedobacter lycopersici]|uniref:hypothetical protein n=1 Tax=Parapedobacter lycopersici TaxID=1864939 RepID=UPI003340F788